jgi:hypothetical protein
MKDGVLKLEATETTTGAGSIRQEAKQSHYELSILVDHFVHGVSKSI